MGLTDYCQSVCLNKRHHTHYPHVDEQGPIVQSFDSDTSLDE